MRRIGGEAVRDMELRQETAMHRPPDYTQLGPDPEPLTSRFDAIMRSAVRRGTRHATPRRERRPHRPARRPETPGQAHARRVRACAEAHARAQSALRDLDLAIRGSDRWCDQLALTLEETGAGARELRHRLRRSGYIH
jgi:hypothetical protein